MIEEGWSSSEERCEPSREREPWSHTRGYCLAVVVLTAVAFGYASLAGAITRTPQGAAVIGYLGLIPLVGGIIGIGVTRRFDERD